jgi:hypothetical protein
VLHALSAVGNERRTWLLRSEQSASSALVAVETKHLGRYPMPLCNSFHVKIVEAFLNFRSFLSAAVSCHLKHSCFYYKVFHRPYLLVLAAPFPSTTGSNFFTCTLAPTIHIHLFHLFSYSPRTVSHSAAEPAASLSLASVPLPTLSGEAPTSQKREASQLSTSSAMSSDPSMAVT